MAEEYNGRGRPNKVWLAVWLLMTWKKGVNLGMTNYRDDRRKRTCCTELPLWEYYLQTNRLTTNLIKIGRGLTYKLKFVY